MEMSRRKWVTVAIATGALAGSAGIAGAVTGSSSTSNPPANSTPATPKYNTDPAHEAGESAPRQADEASGKAGFGRGGPGGHSNTDPAHEAGESASRKAEETQRDAGTSSDTSGTSTATPGQ